MALDFDLRGQVSKKWLEAAQKASPDAKHLMVLAKRPKLKRDQERAAKMFGKTKCRTGMATLVTEEQAKEFSSLAMFCRHCTL